MQRDPVQIIEDSPLFDAAWYRRVYPDAQLYDRSAAHHYAVYGGTIGRDPGPDFCTAAYLARYPEVAEAGHNALWHYELFGRAEGREVLPSPLADAAPDPVAQSMIDRAAPEPLADAAAEVLDRVFGARLEGRPHRLMTEFDHAGAARFVNALSARHAETLAARNTLVSVIMPTRDRAVTLTRAVRSVLGQSHHNLELIVVDDGSTDFTSDVVNALAADPRVVPCHQPQGGVSSARNLGLSRARGEVIFYLDSDNIWTPDFVRLMLIALEVSGARCGYAASRLHDRSGKVVGYRGEPFDWAHCINGNYVDLNVFCHRADMVKEYGGFDDRLRRMVDWDLVLRYTHSNRPIYCPFIGCLYSDDASDETRISTSKPYVFQRVVSHKNALGFDSLSDTLDNLRYVIAIKQGQTPEHTTDEVAAALERRGHRVRCDGPETWQSRHPHDDEIVLIRPSADGYVPHPEQLNIWLGERAERTEGVEATVPTDGQSPEAVAEAVEARVRAYLQPDG
ncbi:hypothetical protein BOO69_19215 (plasmid) [Sulfitobacter alexandrii]|uniref:Glycosyltransferase 2-like domain-containing protein n=1 Tax=Sulfitobacter alexandrii TaxID=1917485 RepID=A0A1J0WNF3_9RHOB|nr:glycosyltransferase family A protein [Sulfitobacter alexandrii]APE45688.1 hypothetical protein BOO69_19215 [Sulfitobacter alexandrii]